ncbi:MULTISPECIES: entericidin A/B family lipoprotein [Modicisalibacter]|uniref:Entericidin A/B family lipoprotein n=1 Tax=Modicisalibacter tunisiensis TaxID=390637 RepID=A0ABS7WYM6_9GAMM|nr:MULTISPECIES: entericidin A/B family lipoprotein [Modicisalibacter]KXS39879.1 MAG: hypothetical protein AWU55_254 [Halomonadaceae bacterium T82-2]MBZ9539349.1 entericidin A/B family lipoprotein [Modicisalibacter tunisiensis]MBZ9567254.1 entericidin A/B family lipoprotein [Modicisalibacter tunisiensis]
MNKLAIALALLMLAGLAGCNTMHGFGRDVQKVGSEIEEAASGK